MRAVYSTLAAEDIARAVEAAYPAGRVSACSLVRRGFNDVYELQFESGLRCVARLSGFRARGESNIAYEASLLSHLRDAGAAVAAPWLTRDSTAWIQVSAVEGERTLAVFEYLRGETPGDALADIEATGVGLARIHSAAQTYQGLASRYNLDIEHLFLRPLNALLRAPTLDEQLHKDFSSIANRLEKRVADLSALSRIECHGDCHGGNNFMTDGADGARVASFFDFDDAGPGYLAYDLAVYLWSLLMGKAAPDAVTNEKWSRYLDGYRQIRSIPSADFDAIAAFVLVRHFWFMGEHASRSHEWGTQALPRRWLRKQVELLLAWELLATPSS